MILPNKFTTLDQSILAKAPKILIVLDTAKNLESLYSELGSVFEDVGEFIVAMDLLYYLEKIDITEDNQIFRK